MSQKKKTLFILQLPPPVHGVSVIGNYIRNSELINDSFSCEYLNLATSSKIEELQAGSFLKYFKTLKIILCVFLKLFFKRYKIVYLTFFPFGFSFLKDSLIILICKLFGYKPILHLHTHGFKSTSQKSVFRKKFYRFVFKNTEVICLSEFLREDIEELFQGKVYILPNGIPAVNEYNIYNNQSSPVNLLFLSHLIKGKGLLLLLDALKIVKKNGTKFHLNVVGAEFDLTYEMLEKYIHQADLSDMVSLLGPKYNEDKYAEFKKAGIFILPSNYDTFGLVLLEAMQFGVPCISSNIGGIPDVLGDGRGVLLNELTDKHLAEAIEDLIQHPDKRQNMSQKSFEYFKSHFTLDVFEKNFLAILKGESTNVIQLQMKSEV